MDTNRPCPTLSRASIISDILLDWLVKNQKALELGQYSKVTFELIIGKRSGNPVKLRSLLSYESDLTSIDP